MPPQFQSTFIPKGPVATTAGIPQAKPVRQHNILSFIAKGVFTLSLLLAVGVVGYKWYLNYSIGKMSAELEAARQEVASGVTGELIRLNDRIVSTETLIQNHLVLSPFFSFLQTSTPKSVRFTDFSYTEGKEGPQILLKGAAKSYSALALEANAIYKDKNFRDPVFSEIRLDEKGNVTFSLKSGVSPELISYTKTVSRLSAPVVVPVATSTVSVATSTAATSTAKTAPTTPKTATSTPH